MSMREIASYGSAIDAHVDKAFLESQGIVVRILNEHVANANPAFGLAMGVKLQVKDDEAGRALQLLKEIRT